MTWLLALIAILAIGGLVALSSKPNPKTPQVRSDQQSDGAAKRDTQSNGDANSANQPSSIEQRDTSGNSKREADKDAQNRAEEASEYWPFRILGARLKITDSLLAIFTFFLIVVGAIQGVFLYRTDEGTHKAAKAAKESADVAKETLVSVQRAFLYPEQMQQVRVMQDGKVVGWLFQALWKNSGTTPSPYVAFRSSGAVFEKDIDKDFLFPEPFASEPSFLGPQGKVGGPTIGVKIEDLAAVRDGKKFLYVWGSAEFDDAFSGTPRHRVEFCNLVEIGGDLTQENMPVAYAGCSRHNRLYDIDRNKSRKEYLGELPPAFASRDTGAKYALSPPPLSKEGG